MKRLYNYINGNVNIQLFDNGTKIIECPDDVIPNMEYPMSMDVKITNYCNLNCPFCHEMSNMRGKHSNLNKLLSLLKKLPRGTELALGGGNTLSHPHFTSFLMNLKTIGLVPSMTINSQHIKQYQKEINFLIEKELIYGVGISINDDFNFNDINLIHNTSNCVYHIIAGVNTLNIFNAIKETKINKVLTLGYKTVGRGIKYDVSNKEKIEKGIKEFSEYFKNPKSNLLYCFDNLSITQLKIQDIISPKQWAERYMGDDGTFTMYIDAVEWIYASSSTSKKRIDIGILAIDEIYKTITQQNNNE